MLIKENVVSFLFSILKPIEYWTLNCQQFCSAEDFFSCNNMCLFDIIRRTENSRCTQNLCTKGYFLFNWNLPIARRRLSALTRIKIKSEMNYNQTDYKIWVLRIGVVYSIWYELCRKNNLDSYNVKIYNTFQFYTLNFN